MEPKTLEINHNHRCERCTKPFACNGECTQYCERCTKEKQENKPLKEIIASYSNTTEEEAKLLFIRKSATEAYSKNEIQEATKNILISICEISIVASMSKEEISSHIANLEKARSFLAAFTQGLVTAYQSELEPIFKAKHEKEQREKREAKLVSNKDKKVNELIEKARQLALNPLTGKLENPNKKVITKITCEKCSKEVFSLKFHRC